MNSRAAKLESKIHTCQPVYKGGGATFQLLGVVGIFELDKLFFLCIAMNVKRSEVQNCFKDYYFYDHSFYNMSFRPLFISRKISPRIFISKILHPSPLVIECVSIYHHIIDLEQIIKKVQCFSLKVLFTCHCKNKLISNHKAP